MSSTYYSDITTPEAVIRQLQKADPSATPSAAAAEYADFFTLLTKDIIPMISAYIMRYCGRSFTPFVATETYYLQDIRLRDPHLWRGNSKRLMLDGDLLVPSSVTWDGTLLANTEWREGDPRRTPYYYLDFNPMNSTISLFPTDDFNAAVEVAGTWGYHNSYSQCYTAVEPITLASTTATAITVVASSAYELLQYVRCEDELMQIVAKPTPTSLTVRRGVNGTSAATHSAATLSIYNPAPDVRQAATRLAAWAYQHRNDLGDRINFADGSSVVTEMPAFVREVLDRLKRIPVAFGAS